ncbi:MAG TPA: hypothetical protein VGM10_06785 [Actinocrinis sp.]
MSQYQVPPAGGYPEQGAGYPAQPEGQQPAEVTVEAAGGLGLPTEFNHLFRDSTPEDRRSIDRGPNRIGAAQAGFGQQQAPAFPQQGGYPAAENGYPAQQQGYAPQQGAYPPYEQQDQGAFNGLSTQTGYAEQFPGAQQQYQDGQYPQQTDGGFGSGPYVPGFQDPQYPDGSGAHLPVSDGAQAPGIGRKRLLIGGGAAAAVVVIALVVSFSSSGGSGKPAASQTTSSATASASATSPQAAATAIYTLIQQSTQLRSDANSGVIDITSCTNLSSAQSDLSSTAQQRTAQATNVAKINVSALTGGAQLVSALQQAWSASAAYDSDFAKIVPDVSSACTSDKVKADANYAAANNQASTADTQKANAAQLWNANPTTSALGQISADSL